MTYLQQLLSRAAYYQELATQYLKMSDEESRQWHSWRGCDDISSEDDYIVISEKLDYHCGRGNQAWNLHMHFARRYHDIIVAASLEEIIIYDTPEQQVAWEQYKECLG